MTLSPVRIVAKAELVPDMELESDLDAALSRIGGDRRLFAELAALFLDEFPQSIHKLRLAVAQGNAPEVEAYAHGLKGSVSNFGAAQTVQFAGRLEEKGRQRDLAGATDILTALERSLEFLSPKLRALIRDR